MFDTGAKQMQAFPPRAQVKNHRAVGVKVVEAHGALGTHRKRRLEDINFSKKSESGKGGWEMRRRTTKKAQVC